MGEIVNIDDVPWMEKLKSLEKEMMKTVEEADKVKALPFFLFSVGRDSYKWEKRYGEVVKAFPLHLNIY